MMTTSHLKQLFIRSKLVKPKSIKQKLLSQTLLSLAIIQYLTACNDDDDDSFIQPSPPSSYVEPQIIIDGHRGASALRP